MKKQTTRLIARWLPALFLAAIPHMVFAADFEPLIGQWQRPDGGYVIEIRSIAPSGDIAAAYFNPRPINVSQAQASMQENHIMIEIELRDVGYPGSKYTLVYDPSKDRLIGFYYHAVSGQNFGVVFVRMR